jgi:hypothetical protein
LKLDKKLLIPLVFLLSMFLSTNGGFRINHIDSEYHQTLYNKSYFLHNIYHIASKVELEVKKLFLPDRHYLQKTDLKTFKQKNQRHGICIYLINGLFAALGVLFCYRLAFLLSANFWLSCLASFILCFSYFWNAESHYSTTDVPLSSLIIYSTYYIFERHESQQKTKFSDLLYEGCLLGACFSVKYAGLIFLIPYLFFKYKTKKLSQSFFPIIISILVLAVSVGDKYQKLLQYINREIKVQTTDGWAGYNSLEPGFIYQVKNSLFNEYGLMLTILAIIGAVYFYKTNIEKKLYTQTIFIFIICLFIMISSTVIKTVRFALPSIPFLAIFSAVAIFYIYNQVKNKNKNLANLSFGILLIFALAIPLSNTIKHNYLLTKPDTIHLVNLLRDNAKKQGAINISMDTQKLFDKSPNLDDPEYLNRCISKPLDFTKIYKFADYPNLIVTVNSFQLDRFIFDKTYHCNYKRKAFTNFDDLRVLQMNPFDKAKEAVPFSFLSNFSPRKPDLRYRNYRGAFFEMFYVDTKYEKLFKQICKLKNFPCKFIDGKESYFLNHIQTSFRDPIAREAIKNLGVENNEKSFSTSSRN